MDQYEDSGSDSSVSSDSSSGSESGSSSLENDSGTSTPTPDHKPLRYQLPSRWSSTDKTDKTDLLEDDLQVFYTGTALFPSISVTGQAVFFHWDDRVS